MPEYLLLLNRTAGDFGLFLLRYGYLKELSSLGKIKSWNGLENLMLPVLQRHNTFARGVINNDKISVDEMLSLPRTGGWSEGAPIDMPVLYTTLNPRLAKGWIDENLWGINDADYKKNINGTIGLVRRPIDFENIPILDWLEKGDFTYGLTPTRILLIKSGNTEFWGKDGYSLVKDLVDKNQHRIFIDYPQYNWSPHNGGKSISTDYIFTDPLLVVKKYPLYGDWGIGGIDEEGTALKLGYESFDDYLKEISKNISLKKFKDGGRINYTKLF